MPMSSFDPLLLYVLVPVTILFAVVIVCLIWSARDKKQREMVCLEIATNSIQRINKSALAVDLTNLYIVAHAYTPNLSDELALKPGQQVIVARIYADDWAFCLVAEQERHGFAPLACLQKCECRAGSWVRSREISKRTASMVQE